MKIPRKTMLAFFLFVFSACKEAHCHLDSKWMTIEKEAALRFISKKWMNEDSAADRMKMFMCEEFSIDAFAHWIQIL